MAKNTVDEYIGDLDDWRGDIVSQLRGLILETAPEATESIKWAQPVYEDHGPFAHIKAFKKHVNFGFWRGAELEDPEGLLIGEGEKMRHVKITGVEDMQPDAFTELVQSAVALNRERGDPTKG
jgi:hypothetical protein